ncbi:MAG: excinuclease ABC subunit UvrC [Victivallaceae bacterium]|nr:excinuclease ABC subunit UvrC [Victivallaceae bacterium]
MNPEAKPFHPGDVPAKPGVYVYRDRFGTVIYVGKAADLRHRMSQYFQPGRLKGADPRLRSLLNSIYDWDFFVVGNEDEALLLESRLIKEYAPQYNVLMRDDKRFLLVKIDLKKDFPRLDLARIRKDDGCKYFGPFPRGSALRSTIEFLSAYFGLRTCKVNFPDEHTRRHCLKRSVNDCLEPCAGRITKARYRQQVEKMLQLLNGNISPIIGELEGQMAAAAEKKQFELAARLRDVITNIAAVFGRKNRSFRYAALPAPPGAAAVEALRRVLNLASPPARVECFDVSNILGTLAVAGMVCFEDGRPARDQYRRFKIRSVDRIDDFAMLREAVKRHYSRKLHHQLPLPDLLLVDGGRGQLSAALEALAEINCPLPAVAGLAKKNEEIFLPGRSEALVLDRHSPALRLLQAMRDEAHRFAVGYHRRLRARRLQESLLDEIPGVGPKRKRLLLQQFGSIRRLRQAGVQEIREKIPGAGRIFAERIVEFLHGKD